MKKLIVGALAALVAVPAASQEETVAEEPVAEEPVAEEPEVATTLNYKRWRNGWEINYYEDSINCLAARAYEGGDNLIIAYDPSKNTAMVSISDNDSTSLKEGELVTLQVIFVGNNAINNDWSRTSFEVFKSGSKSQMIGKFDGREMLRDVARYELMAFSIDGTADRLVGAYNLDGSAAAMESLRKCSFERSGLNPNDPFLR